MNLSLPSRQLKQSLAALVAAAIGITTTSAAIYTWRGTNSTVWSDSGNWLAKSIAPTNGSFAHRLEVNNAAFNPMIYDAGQGTTIYGGVNVRGLVVGSGALGSGTMTISGGAFITTNSTISDVVGNNDNNAGILNISGGTFVSGPAAFSLGLGGGAGRVSTLNVNSGAATMATVSFNATSGTINYNGGTTSFTNMVAALGFGTTATNNFNGGTVKARANHATFIPVLSQANVRDGGAIIDSAGFNITIVPPLAHSVIPGDAAVDGGLTKIGGGTLTLGVLPSYTGPTIVKAGRLTTPLPTVSSALVVADGARFSPALTNRPWLVSSATLTNAAIDFNYVSFNANADPSAAISIGSLAISGSVTCNIGGASLPITNLTLLSYGGKTGGGTFVLGSLPPGLAATLNDDGANLTLNITAPSIQSLVWSTGNGIWQTNGGLNWNGNSAQYLEYPTGSGDIVAFNDTAGGTVTVTGQVIPASTTVDVSSSFYTFSGTGRIGGTNGIAKLGTSTLQIDNANNFTGPVTLSGGSGTVGGTLYVNNPEALGATNGAVTVEGPANTLEIGVPGGNGIAVSNKSLTINGTGVGGARGALRGAAVAAGQTNIWAGPVSLGTDLARIGTEDGGNLVVAGNITDNGANRALLLRPGIGGTVTIASTGNNYAFTRTFGDASTSFIVLGANDAFATNRLDLGLGNVDLNGFNQTVAGVADNSGPGRVINNGAAASTLAIHTGTNITGSFSTAAAIVDGTGALNIVKLGKGSQTFSSPEVTYSGPTTIADGQLNLASINPMNTAITVLGGGALGGEGTTTKSLTLSANATIAFNPGTVESFTANTIDATASPIKVLPTTTATNDVLVLNAPGGITGLAANFQVVGSRGGSFYLTNGNTQLMFSPNTVNASLVWKGNNGVNPTFWDTITTTNWSNGGSPDLFYAGDHVLFDDTASTNAVTITGGTVQPSSMTVIATNDYTFAGTLGGGGTVTKGGSGTLFFANNNSYTGPTVITNGLVNIQTSGALGSTASGTTVSGSGTLDFGTGAVLANTINIGGEVLTISGNGFGGNGAIVNSSLTSVQINAVQQVVLAGNASIGGNQRWDMRGAGNALDMQSTNTLTKVGVNQISLVNTLINNPGNIVVNEGVLSIEVGALLNGDFSNALTVNNGATLGFWSFSGFAPWTLVLNGGSTVLGSAGFSAWSGPVTLNGASTLNASAGSLNIDGTITGNGSIIKNGSLDVTLSASNSYAGNTTVNAGTLSLAWPSLASASTVTIASNAVLNLNFAETNTVAVLVLNGVSQSAGVYDATTGAPYITGSGALRVTSSAPPTLNFTNLGGGQLQFSWTGGGTLQAQTNSISTGLGSTWVDYPGSSPVTLTVDPAAGCVFFRVKQ